jgi:hypothetical protein
MSDGRFFRRKVEKSLAVSSELCSFAAEKQNLSQKTNKL